MIDYVEIDKRWQGEWEKAKIFESEPDGRKELMVTGAFPYVNLPQHIGHLRTFGTADVLARYKRMQGFNVLFPMGMHGTGTPVIAVAKRIKEGDSTVIDELKEIGLSEEVIRSMTEPEKIIDYFSMRTPESMKKAGYSIDWRRKFISIEPRFSKFVEWQFGILSSMGFFTRGRHPVGWCPNDNNAVGMHDTKHDVEPEIEAETAIKFGIVGEDAKVLCATYRPETVFGVTNIFVNKNEQYVLCSIGGDTYYIAKKAVEKLSYQMKIDVIKEVAAGEMLNKKCINPVTNEVVPVLPGFFVKGDVGTGIVMSVPAHAPFDYAALERLKLENYPMPEIKPKKIIDVKIGRSLSDVQMGDVAPVHVDMPALAYLEVLHTNINAIDDMLEFATKLQYREESHWGKMLVKGYEGMSEPEAREKVKSELLKGGNAMDVYVLANAPVFCRCGAEIVVKVVDDQWFLNYGDEKWKEKAKEALGQINIMPPNAAKAFESALAWIGMRAVARSRGLGTRFPLDNRYIIESLSDSTIYMAYYTISHLIKDVEIEKLKPEFFDYVFRGKGDADAVSKNTGIDYDLVKKCRESFEYWYANTSRHSGPDLIFNHLTMYIFNHTAIFDRKYWPKQIVVNGSVLSEGEKMSKSIGNVVSLDKALEEHGADPLRIVVVAGADLFSDSEYSIEAVNGTKERLGYLYNIVDKIDEYESGELKPIDYWLASVLNRKIKNATGSMERLELRTACTEILFNSVIELRRYFERGGSNGIVLREFMQDIVLMLQPIAPHIAEEMWHMLGNSSFVSLEKWPVCNEQMINEKAEKGERMLDGTIEDIKSTLALIAKKGEKFRKIRIITAAAWKKEVVDKMAEERNMGKVAEHIKASESIKDKDSALRLAAQLAKKMNEVSKAEMSSDDEYMIFSGAKDYLSKIFSMEVEVEKEESSKSPRAARAMPGRPAIALEA